MTPDVRLAVLERDRGCLAVIVGKVDPSTCRGPLTLDHVKDQPAIGAPVVKRGPERKRRYRAPSDPAHLATVCHEHHLYGWATAHRGELRDYLKEKAS